MKGWMMCAASLVAVFVGLMMTTARAADATFTAEQAKRGEEIYMDWGRCYYCHGRNLEGKPKHGATSLVGDRFIRSWSARPLSELHRKVHLNMPPGGANGSGAGTLLENQVSDLVAFMLQRNGVPPGATALPSRGDQLTDTMIKR